MDTDINVNILDNYINDDLYNHLIYKLNLYVELLCKLQNDDNLRYYFIQKNKREKYKYIIEYINI